MGVKFCDKFHPDSIVSGRRWEWYVMTKIYLFQREIDHFRPSIQIVDLIAFQTQLNWRFKSYSSKKRFIFFCFIFIKFNIHGCFRFCCAVNLDTQYKKKLYFCNILLIITKYRDKQVTS